MWLVEECCHIMSIPGILIFCHSAVAQNHAIFYFVVIHNMSSLGLYFFSWSFWLPFFFSCLLTPLPFRGHYDFKFPPGMVAFWPIALSVRWVSSFSSLTEGCFWSPVSSSFLDFFFPFWNISSNKYPLGWIYF